MAEFKSYEPGMFCWVELATSDAAAAKEFYTSLFGWGTNESPISDNEVYTMWTQNGRDLGAMFPNKDVPPNWASYVAVASVDQSAAKAKELGANVIAGPFDVMEHGRMCVITDPQGAHLALWEGRGHKGASVRNETNTLCWNELQTTDVGGARDFYHGLFGWNFKGDPNYTEVHLGETGIGGIMASPVPGIPPFWMPYFLVDDCDATTAKAKSLGGSAHVEPTDIPNVGRFSVLVDPQGAVFAIIKPAM